MFFKQDKQLPLVRAIEVSTQLAAAYESMSKDVSPYRDGKAYDRIVRALKGEWVGRHGA